MKLRRLNTLLLSALVLTACSPTKLLPGEYLLGKSKVKILEDKTLEASEVNPYIRSAEKYTPSIVTSSVSNIDNHLKYIGYYKSSINPETEFKGKKARVTYNITPSGRIKIDSIVFKLPEEGGLRDAMHIYSRFMSVHPGDYLSEESLVAESDACASFLRNLGYYDINKNQYSFVADSVSKPGTMILEYVISPNVTPARYTIGDVNIHYPESLPFREKVLRELNSIHPGDRYSDRAVTIAYNRLSNLKLFNSVNVEMNPSESDSTVIDCDITLQPSDIQGFKADLEASVNSTGLFGISPKLSYFHKNIFHGGEWLNLDFNGNFQRRFSDNVNSNEFGVSLSLSLPRFLGISTERFRADRIPRTEFKASFNYQSRPEYSRRISSVSYSYSGNNAARRKYLTYKFTPLRINTVKLGNLSDSFKEVILQNPMLWTTYMDHIDAGVSGNIYFSDVQSPNPKTDYKYLRASVSLSGNVISLFQKLMPKDDLNQGLVFGLPFSQYARTEIQLGKTWRLGQDNRQAFASRLLFGIGKAYGNSSSLPYEESFYCGGANSMRAWQARSLGPGSEKPDDFFKIPSQVGDLKLEFDAEYRFPLFWKLYGALFAEVGNVWSLDDYYEKQFGITDDALFRFDRFYKQLAADWGVGVRMDIDLIVLRFDFGMKLREPSREQCWLTPAQWFQKNGFGFHFGVGYPF